MSAPFLLEQSEVKHNDGVWSVLNHPTDGVFVLADGAMTICEVAHMIKPGQHYAHHSANPMNRVEVVA